MSPKVIFGLMGSSVASSSQDLSTIQGTIDLLKAISSHSITELDTARVYNGGKSEELLGQVNAADSDLMSHFKISTKAPAFAPGTLAPEKVRRNCEASLKALGGIKCDIYYLHGPDRQTPLEDQCRIINELSKEGKFEKFGVSNISPAEVQTMHDLCQKNGWIKPSIYQGGYNPVGRGAETELFPILRQLGMNFYAYSPLAGGFLAKPLDQLLNPEKGSRFDAMQNFGEIYLREPVIEARKKLEHLLRQEGLSLKDATLRWLMHHCILGEEDGIILGARDEKQAEENLKAVEGGTLKQEIVECIDAMWDSVKEGAWPSHS